ncbi:hypothetical protein B0H16DRAFT_1462409 [Mycena metata]|uniref:Uncharacterized protein n=1 Tax=Mycena metata TaxID=1033252 RepID=A0AAD7N5Q7_9AGAR|nr:hypothetical protein B0H16DRAFT_1462409 [Mycena metata]
MPYNWVFSWAVTWEYLERRPLQLELCLFILIISLPSDIFAKISFVPLFFSEITLQQLHCNEPLQVMTQHRRWYMLGPDFMVLQLNKVLIYNTYLLPESAQWARALEKDPYEALTASLTLVYAARLPILDFGDLNTRTALLMASPDDLARTSMDTANPSPRGRWLCEVFNDYNIVFISGVDSLDTSSGKFTSFQGKTMVHKTVIDYAAYSRELFSKIKSLNVEDQVPGYDHLPTHHQTQHWRPKQSLRSKNSKQNHCFSEDTASPSGFANSISEATANDCAKGISEATDAAYNGTSDTYQQPCFGLSPLKLTRIDFAMLYPMTTIGQLSPAIHALQVVEVQGGNTAYIKVTRVKAAGVEATKNQGGNTAEIEVAKVAENCCWHVLL